MLHSKEQSYSWESNSFSAILTSYKYKVHCRVKICAPSVGSWTKSVPNKLARSKLLHYSSLTCICGDRIFFFPSNPETEGIPLFGCLPLLIQYIHSNHLHIWRTSSPNTPWVQVTPRCQRHIHYGLKMFTEFKTSHTSCPSSKQISRCILWD